MSEIIASEKKSGKVSTTRKLIRVDMTPMVDLGFLLITFFMFTTNFSKPNVMDLGLPAKGPIDTSTITIKDKNQITFIIGKDNKVFYHQSNADELKTSNLLETDFDGIKISKIISDAHKSAPNPDIFTVIIKPTNDANYKNFVDILDNLAITKSEHYGITDIKPWEKKIYNEKLK